VFTINTSATLKTASNRMMSPNRLLGWITLPLINPPTKLSDGGWREASLPWR